MREELVDVWAWNPSNSLLWRAIGLFFALSGTYVLARYYVVPVCIPRDRAMQDLLVLGFGLGILGYQELKKGKRIILDEERIRLVMPRFSFLQDLLGKSVRWKDITTIQVYRKDIPGGRGGSPGSTPELIFHRRVGPPMRVKPCYWARRGTVAGLDFWSYVRGVTAQSPIGEAISEHRPDLELEVG